jgi:hypothetical protein
MNRARIALIVGGHGETEAVPILIRRIASAHDPGLHVDFVPTFRVPEDRLRKTSELERHVEIAARRLAGDGGILILLDCDWNAACAKRDAPELLHRARAVRPDIPISVVLACQEFETWFIAAARSLRGKRGLPEDLETPELPEGIRGAKEWLRNRMPRHRPYAETVDQPALTAAFDLQEARRAPSFDKCYRSIEWLLSHAIVD